MVGKSDFNENSVVSPDMNLDLGFVNKTIILSSSMKGSYLLQFQLRLTIYSHLDV